MAVALAHRDPTMVTNLSASLQAVLGSPPAVLPCEADGLRGALRARDGGWVVLDIDLVPAVSTILRTGGFLLIAVTHLPEDPRAAKLVQSGAVVLPVDQVAPYLAQVLRHSISQPEPAPTTPDGARPHIVAIHSPKGGAGTTTLAAYLASAWAHQGQQTLLIDLTSYGGLTTLCKLPGNRSGFADLIDAIEQDSSRLEDPEFDLPGFCTNLFAKPGRLDILSAASPRGMDRLKGEQALKLVARFAQLPYDRVVIDTAAEPTPRTMAAAATADDLLLVTTMDYMSGWSLVQFRDVLDLARPSGRPLLVINRAEEGAGLSAADLAEKLKFPLIATIPEDPSVRQAGNRGLPWEQGAQTTFARVVWELASALSG